MNAATRALILRKHAQGYSATEISHALRLPLDEVRAVIIAGDGRPRPARTVEFIPPPDGLFDL